MHIPTYLRLWSQHEVVRSHSDLHAPLFLIFFISSLPFADRLISSPSLEGYSMRNRSCHNSCRAWPLGIFPYADALKYEGLHLRAAITSSSIYLRNDQGLNNTNWPSSPLDTYSTPHNHAQPHKQTASACSD